MTSTRTLETPRKPAPTHLAALAAALLALAAAAPLRVAAEEEAAGDLDWTVGTWEGVRRGGDGGDAEPATLRVEPILGGAGYAEHLEVSPGDGVYRGYAVTVFDAGDGRWVRYYVNAVRGSLVRLDGEIDGPRSVWRVTTPGRTRESRLTSEPLEGERWRRTHEISEDGGATWRVLWRDELERVSGH